MTTTLFYIQQAIISLILQNDETWAQLRNDCASIFSIYFEDSTISLTVSLSTIWISNYLYTFPASFHLVIVNFSSAAKFTPLMLYQTISNYFFHFKHHWFIFAKNWCIILVWLFTVSVNLYNCQILAAIYRIFHYKHYTFAIKTYWVPSFLLNLFPFIQFASIIYHSAHIAIPTVWLLLNFPFDCLSVLLFFLPTSKILSPYLAFLSISDSSHWFSLFISGNSRSSP